MDFEKIVVPLATAVLGFLSGLAAPWIKSRVDEATERRTHRRSLIAAWRAKLAEVDEVPPNFGDTHEYASLRAHMQTEVVKKFEAPRTVYFPGGRGMDVRKQMLVDEIARIEKAWGLL
ncbi:hypothetical protein AB4Z32_22315 [Massilia sp. 2TAF26]|uniref:hypothetical protein n=1 Tax=Massilia sp. 2TAF26 TaxID=3233012 RepID=UPI003F975709